LFTPILRDNLFILEDDVLTGDGLETLRGGGGLETVGEDCVLILDVVCEVLFLNLEPNLPAIN